MPQLPQRQRGISRHPKLQATIADKTTGFCNTITPTADISGPGRLVHRQRQARCATTHGEAREVKLGGFSAPTQDVSGASGA
jgi:hypothetical protein